MIYHLAKENSLVKVWMNELRNPEIQKDRMRFRRNMERIGEVAAYELSKTMDFEEKIIDTPLGEKASAIMLGQPVITTILRAGVPLFQGVLNYFDQADCSFIAAYRQHTTGNEFEINQQYVTCPELEDRVLILADPMLATGASLITALDELRTYGTPKAIHIVVAVACTAGISNVRKHYPELNFWIADIDEELTAKGYIVPGLGDAGDLAYGSKMQD
jgi:uracil phosphoribosyltransferase